MATLSDLINQVVAFRDARDWQQFHNAKDMSLSLMLEAAELAEHFQWKRQEEIEAYLKDEAGKGPVAEELADVLYWVLLMSHDFGIDLGRAFREKMAVNEQKYPVSLAKGRKVKYDRLPR